MRLISAGIDGYGRLVETKVNLDSKLIAVVGPNEAGKTSMLDALNFLTTGGSVPQAKRSRSIDVDDETIIVECKYILDNSDTVVLEDLFIEEMPKSLTVSRRAGDGPVYMGFTPSIRKSLGPLKKALAFFKDTERSPHLRDVVQELDGIPAGFESEAPVDALIEWLAYVIENSVETLSDPVHEFIGSLREIFENSTDVQFLNILEELHTWHEVSDVDQEARDRVYQRVPQFILFDLDNRSLHSSYTLNKAFVNNVPRAFHNLARAAELDIKALLRAIQQDDMGLRETLILHANRKLARLYRHAWKQATLEVRLALDGDQLYVQLLEDDTNVTVFDERSAGLRMFVALVAFLYVSDSQGSSIILIDEAETHLHIDAQADLINMFLVQDQVDKIIYTTHSPACLPPDLGTGIRLINPREDNPGSSEIKNSFWQAEAGFSPLMFAMGASAAAFTPARYAVLGEGPTEMILMPSLIRLAVNVPELPYQISQGLSELSQSLMAELSLEAARVAYLVDGGAGGESLRQKLYDAGVDEEHVVALSVPGIENLLEPTKYYEAFKALVTECNPTVGDISIPTSLMEASDECPSIAIRFENWAKNNSLQAPSKVGVANWFIQNPTERIQLTAEGTKELIELNQTFYRILGVDSRV